MSYDETTDTLTLDNYIGNTPINARAISEKLTIELIGNNHMASNTGIEINGLIAAYNLNITGPGMLLLSDGNDEIYMVQNLNIEDCFVSVYSIFYKK